MSPDELVGVLEGDPVQGGGRIELATGQVWPDAAFEYRSVLSEEEEGELEEPGKWLWVHCEGSRDGYRDMERFIQTVSDPGRADRLDIAITGRGAFRRFKDVLARFRPSSPPAQAGNQAELGCIRRDDCQAAPERLPNVVEYMWSAH